MKRLSWAIRLERAEKRGKFTDHEVMLAASWTKCAIGERHNFPATDDYTHTPLFWQTKEERLGCEFYAWVYAQNISDAKRTYRQIQALP